MLLRRQNYAKGSRYYGQHERPARSPRRRSRRSRNMGSRPRSACYPPTGARTRQENLRRRHGRADFLVSSRSRAWPRTWPARWPRIRRFPSSACRAAARSSTAWTRCSRPSRCRAASPVATVAIDGAKNAAILAVQIMAVSDEGLAHKLQAARDEGTAAVLKADEELRERYKN